MSFSNSKQDRLILTSLKSSFCSILVSKRYELLIFELNYTASTPFLFKGVKLFELWDTEPQNLPTPSSLTFVVANGTECRFNIKNVLLKKDLLKLLLNALVL